MPQNEPRVISVSDQHQLVPTARFPHARFPFPNFNVVQSRLFESYDKDANCLVAASTSAGKTVCAEMFISHEVRARGGKGMYLSPLKALAEEKKTDWSDPAHHFADLNLSVCTGDYQLTADRRAELEAADVVIMSSEMLNSRCRNHRAENNEWLQRVGTLVVDEAHLLTVEGRGDHLESGLVKFARLCPQARIVLLSATLPNVDEISRWIGRLTGKDTYLLVSEYRPVPLGIHYVQYPHAFSYRDGEANKVETAMGVIADYPDDKFLVFAHTKDTQKKMAERLLEAGIECEVHNANLDKKKRIEAERRFKTDPALRVVVATSTLAWGCYEENTLVPMADGVMKRAGDIRVGEKVASLVGDEFVPVEVEASVDLGYQACLRVRTDSGHDLTVNEGHEFWACRGLGGRPDWFGATEIAAGDWLAVPVGYRQFDGVPASDDGYVMGVLAGDGCLVSCGTHADGSLKAAMDIAGGSEDLEHLDYVRTLASKVIGHEIPPLVPDVNGVWHIRSKAKAVSEWAGQVVGVGRAKNDLRVSKSVQADSKAMRGYLQGLFDTDGGVESHSNGSYSVGLSSSCEAFLRQVGMLLWSIGVPCGVGRKRTRDTVINGRVVSPRGEWHWRLRVFNDNMRAFQSRVGFRMPRKMKALESAIASVHVAKDYLPAGGLVKDHLAKSGTNVFALRKQGIHLQAAVTGRQAITRQTANRLLAACPGDTPFAALVASPLRWVRVCSVEESAGKIRMLSVGGERKFFGGGVVSHNCNMPARRVIILGVHRGMSEVPKYDIDQMMGRAGRPQYDKAGDVYILLPERGFGEQKRRLQTPHRIQSQMFDPARPASQKVLGFHLVSEIHHGEVETRDDIAEWYSHTLAAFQQKQLGAGFIDGVIQSLERCGAVKQEGGKFEATGIGKVASLFYYSPYDVSDLARNLTTYFREGREDDHLLSFALGNTDTSGAGICSNAEADEMAAYCTSLVRLGRVQADWRQAIGLKGRLKAGFCYHNLLNGAHNGVLAGTIAGLRTDSGRLVQVLSALDAMAARWGRADFVANLQKRLSYGVESGLLGLIGIDGVGSVKARKLQAFGLKTPKDVAENKVLVIRALGCSGQVADKIVAAARKAAGG